MRYALAALGLLILAASDGTFNGLTILGWVIFGTGLYLHLRRSPER